MGGRQGNLTLLLLRVFFTKLKYLYLSKESIFFGAPYIARRKRIPSVKIISGDELIFLNTSAQSTKSGHFSNNLNTFVFLFGKVLT